MIGTGKRSLTRAAAEAVLLGETDVPGSVPVAFEPYPAAPERWQLDAYFEDKPLRNSL